MNIKKLQDIMLECLNEFHKICVEDKLTYYIIGGTLIGAIRHHGFIPWDDDVDVAMPRDDYEKLIDIFNKSNSSKMINLYNYKTNDNMRCYFSRIIVEPDYALKKGFKKNDTLGMVAIDILPIDGTPNNTILRNIYYKKCMFYRALSGISNLDVKPISKSRTKFEKFILNVCLKLKLYKFIDRVKIYNKLDKLYRKYNWQDSKYSGTITGAYRSKEIVETNLWGNGTLYDFEKYKFYGPDKYDEYLTHMYGNYMQLPPEKDRKKHFE